MKGIEELFEETFNNRWPEFSYRKRTVALSPETLKKEFRTFWFGPWPLLLTNPPSRKPSSQSALSGSGRKASSQKIAAGKGDLDPPQPQPEVVVIEDPGIAPEKKKIDTESDKDEEVIDAAQLEDFLSQP